MKPLSASITHLHHSGFSIETINHFFIFDYTEPAGSHGDQSLESGSITERLLLEKENVYVFISHHHQDHFMPSLLQWQEKNPDIQVIAGFDVPLQPCDNRYLMKPLQKLKVNEVYVESYGSTDEGVSFYVQADHLSIFHAGDLNWWHWEEFSPEEQLREEQDFKREILQLKDRKIDIAFIPVDPRLKQAAFWAGEYVLETLKPDLLIPMHFGGHFEITRQFAEKASHASSNIAVLEKRGHQLSYSKS